MSDVLVSMSLSGLIFHQFSFHFGIKNAIKSTSKRIKIHMDFSTDFGRVLHRIWRPFLVSLGLSLASLRLPLASPWPLFGLPWPLLGLPLVSLGLSLASLGPPLALLGVHLASLGFSLASFWHPLASPWPSFWLS